MEQSSIVWARGNLVTDLLGEMNVSGYPLRIQTRFITAYVSLPYLRDIFI